MAVNYEHLSRDDVGNAVFERFRLEDSTDKETEQLPKKCNICERVNPHDVILCSKCGKCLDLKTTIMQEEKEKEEKNEILKKLVSIENDLAKIKKHQENTEGLKKSMIDFTLLI